MAGSSDTVLKRSTDRERDLFSWRPILIVDGGEREDIMTRCGIAGAAWGRVALL